MHELPITQNILEIALQHAESNKARQIRAVHLVIGELASVVDDSVQFYWDIISKGTMAEGAELVFKRTAAEFLCRDCEKNYTPRKGFLACPTCGGVNVRIVAGREFHLESIDIETAETLAANPMGAGA